MMGIVRSGQDVLDRMFSAVDAVKQRLARAVAALEQARVPYAVCGGNCVAAWVARVDEAAVRFTQDVDVLLNRADLPAARAALEGAGFVFRHAAGIDMFLDGPGGKARNAVHILYADERVKAADPVPTPTLAALHRSEDGVFDHLSLEGIVRMKLVANRDKDRTHLRDMIGVGLLDETWPAKFSAPLAERLQALLDDPDG